LAVYVDTSAWIALHEPREGDHKAAKRTLERLVKANAVMVVGWHTVTEFADGLARHYDQGKAAEQVARLLASPRVRIEPNEPHLPRALELLRTRPEWDVDLSDCLSFALMEGLGLREAFTYDADFRKAGFTTLG
jgi:uncharacterized protein